MGLSILVRCALRTSGLGRSPKERRGALAMFPLEICLLEISCVPHRLGVVKGIPLGPSPDDQGFHEEIQFVLFRTHLRQRQVQKGVVGNEDEARSHRGQRAVGRGLEAW